MPTIDLAASTGLAVIVLLGVWVVVLVSMLDRTHMPLHSVWRWVWVSAP